MEWSDSALVLGVGRFREADLWVRLLTRRHGIVTAFAFGGSRSRKRFCGCLDLFNELQISTKTTRNGMYLSLQEGILVRGPQRLRSDWNRVGMLMNCIRFVEALGVSPDTSGEAFALVKETLALLEEAERVQDLLPVLFRLRLASQQGYAPALRACARCGKTLFDPAGFSVAEGTVLCPDCLGRRENIVVISGKALTFCAEFRKNHRCVGILPPRTLPGREMKPFCPRNGANALGPWMVLCNTILA